MSRFRPVGSRPRPRRSVGNTPVGSPGAVLGRCGACHRTIPDCGNMHVLIDPWSRAAVRICCMCVAGLNHVDDCSELVNSGEPVCATVVQVPPEVVDRVRQPDRVGRNRHHRRSA